jgi:hypothetical protein
MSLEENNIKELCVYDPIKLGQLVRDILQKVDELFPPSSDSSLDNSVAQLYTLKNEIKKIDPSWKFENTNTLYVFEILKLLDVLDTGEIPELQLNKMICQRLFHRVRIIRQINSSWNLDIEGIMNFLYPTLKKRSIEPLNKEDQSKENQVVPEVMEPLRH